MFHTIFPTAIIRIEMSSMSILTIIMEFILIHMEFMTVFMVNIQIFVTFAP
jgi:hypothetical protein